MDEKKEIGEIRVGYPDCCFSVGNNWFRYRAGAIIVEDNCFLAIMTKSAGHYYTIGGGVHMNEKAEECIVREVREETGVDYEIDRLAVICENFFVGHEAGLQDLNCHVIEFYYLMKPRGKKEARCESYGWNNDKEEISWIPLEELANTNIKPNFLKTHVKEIVEGKGIIHIVNDER